MISKNRPDESGELEELRARVAQLEAQMTHLEPLVLPSVQPPEAPGEPTVVSWPGGEKIYLNASFVAVKIENVFLPGGNSSGYLTGLIARSIRAARGQK